VGRTTQMAQPKTIQTSFPFIQSSRVKKLQKKTLLIPKNFPKLPEVVDKLKWNIFTFGKKFKFQMDFEIKI
jgi:hypothetical protein